MGAPPRLSTARVPPFAAAALALVVGGCGDDGAAAAGGGAGAGGGGGETGTFTCPRGEPRSPTGATCNGASELCDRPFDEVTFPVTHNAMSNADDEWLAPNQTHGIERQLADGIRGMMLDTHYFDPDTGVSDVRSDALAPLDQTFLCHGACQFGRRRLVEGLCAITQYLDEHPDEVFTILFESDITPADTEVAVQASGLIDYVYSHPARDAPWPTLRAMLEDGTRVLVLTESDGGNPAWYHPAWDLVWDTPYSFDSVDAFSCALNRGQPDNPLFLVNHWLSNPTPDIAYAEQVNVEAVLGARVAQCASEAGRPVNFVGVDFYEVGDLFDVVRAQNGL